METPRLFHFSGASYQAKVCMQAPVSRRPQGAHAARQAGDARIFGSHGHDREYKPAAEEDAIASIKSCVRGGVRGREGHPEQR